MPPLYSPLVPLRLFPNAITCAKGEAAPLTALPLISKPSAARWLRSSWGCFLLRVVSIGWCGLLALGLHGRGMRARWRPGLGLDLIERQQL